jgi:hypothetical protein
MLDTFLDHLPISQLENMQRQDHLWKKHNIEGKKGNRVNSGCHGALLFRVEKRQAFAVESIPDRDIVSDASRFFKGGFSRPY